MRKLRHKRLHHAVTQQSHKGLSALGSSRRTASFAKPLFSVLMSGVTDEQTVQMRDSKRIQPWWRWKFTALPLPWDNVLARALQTNPSSAGKTGRGGAWVVYVGKLGGG